ncbi:MAG: hypothetical protein JNL82_31730 [Myxococcales bacterium]|nr:hypothetical protein [Myxococcales bacterium]
MSTLATLALIAAALAPHAEAATSMPGPSEGHTRRDAADRNAACERCHSEIAAEWRGSLHRRAYTNASFAAALRREPIGFCRGCHAPEADPERAPPRALARLGVGCVTCHSPGAGDGVLAAPRDDLSHETAPHPLRRDPRFAGAAACAGCHEFAFPGGRELMQSTVREHAASDRAGDGCASCHMPPVGADERHRSHAFAASREPAVLRRAVRVQAARGPTAIALALTPGAVGHAFPTGDLFRRLVVVAEVVGDDGRPVAAATRFLARHFTLSRRETADDRVGAPALAGAALPVAFDFGSPAVGRAIRWRVVYERVAFPRASDAHAEVEASVVVADGTLGP